MSRSTANNNIVLIGYSGHSFVLADAILKQGHVITGYMDNAVKELDPFKLKYLGRETDATAKDILKNAAFMVAIGDNKLRKQVFSRLAAEYTSASVIHPGSNISTLVTMGTGLAIMAAAVINPLCRIGDGVIINSGAVVEHECIISPFAHIAPGAVLAGNVNVGEGSFIGAGAVVKQGVRIGNNVIVGAGAVIIRDIPDNKTVVGNPGKAL